MKKLLLKNALIFRDCGFEKTDILIVDGKIAEVRTSIKDEDAEVIDKFLVEHGLTKVDLIMAGFATLVERFNKK